MRLDGSIGFQPVENVHGVERTFLSESVCRCISFRRFNRFRALVEEMDMRRKVNAGRRSTRRSVQIVVAVSVGMAVGLAVLDHAFLSPYDGVSGQFVLVIIGAIYAAGILWLRRLATFSSPERLLGTAKDEALRQAV